jgi:hypothetical protein
VNAFDETKHPRGTGGKFASKSNCDAGVEITTAVGQRELSDMAGHPDPAVRKVAAEHPMSPWYVLSGLLRDDFPSVRVAAASNPTAPRILLTLAGQSEHDDVREAAAAHPLWSRQPLEPDQFRSEVADFVRTLTPDPYDGGACRTAVIQFASQRLSPSESIVYGASDDLIEVDGWHQNEVDHFDAEDVEFEVGDATMFATFGERDGTWGWHFRPGRIDGDTTAFLLFDPKEEDIPEEVLYTQFWVVRSGPGDEA